MKVILIIFAAVILVGIGRYALNLQTLDVANEGSNEAQVSRTTDEFAHDCSGIPVRELAEGPYYKAGSPNTADIYSTDIPGEKLMLEGYVLDTNCRPISGAWLDFWQTDGNGNYDNNGFSLRGHQFTDESGKYSLTTVVPGEYPGRTAHIHFKVKASENAPIITSQLFFPDARSNQSDAIFDQLLIVTTNDTDSGKVAQYNIVLEGK